MTYQHLPEGAEQLLNTFDLHPTSRRGQGTTRSSFLKTFLKSHLPKEKSDQIDHTELVHESRSLDNAVGNTTKKKTKHVAVKRASNRIRKLSKLKLSAEHQQYDMYLSMHRLWKDYMRSIINLDQINEKNLKAVYPHLLKADYHGCLLRVAKSKCPSYVDASGIVIQETKNMFRVITKDNALKSFPKANSVFTFDLDGYRFTIYGNQFRFKSGERVSKHFKGRKLTTDL